ATRALDDLIGGEPQLPPVPDRVEVIEEPAADPPAPEPAPAFEAAETRDLMGPARPVVAFFYPWYAETAWTIPPMSDLPPEHYLSDDEPVMRRQISEAMGAKLDAFASSWAGVGSDTDKNFKRLLDRCPEGFFACPYFETELIKGDHRDITAELLRLRDLYMNHPRYFRWNGKPVIFFWAPKTIGAPAGQTSVQAWRAVRDAVDPQGTQLWNVETKDPLGWFGVFDAFHLFSAADWAAPTADDFEPLLRANVVYRHRTDGYNRRHKTARLFTAGVRPGYNDVVIRDLQRKKDPSVPPGYIREREDGRYYQMSATAATRSLPDGLAIVSYNEWFEGSQIEPSVTYSTRYLDLTPGLVDAYRSVSSPLPTLTWPDGVRYFPESGHILQRGFLEFWNKGDNGKKLGVPVTDEIGETIRGEKYVVQYFTRGFRLQWNTNGKEPTRLVTLSDDDWNREPQ
ncbi:MAG TPA: hypothetical protein VM536_22010, partial [Chloroflexia bacterium]|nr:hypothetical protein [Chloroflexia bacterium]